jgi:ABC-type glycerol-3-phosphate transport system substrate-binding protein
MATTVLSVAAAGCAAADGGAERPAAQTVTPGRFTFMTWWLGGHAMAPFTEEAHRQWRARRPELELEFVAAANAGEIPTKFVTLAAAGDPVDASFMPVQNGRDLYDQGQLLELDPFIRRAPDIADDKFMAASEPFRKTGGKTFGIPAFGPESTVIVASSDALQSVGLDPRGKNVISWDELARAAQQLTRRDGQEVTRSGYQMSSFSLPNFAGWVHTTAAPLFDAEQRRASFSAPGAAAALEFLARLHNGLRVTVPVTQPNRQGSDAALVAGAAAMVDDISSAPIRLRRRAPEFRYWMLPYPKGQGGRGPASATYIQMVALTRGARQPDRALEFVRWFCGSAELAAVRLQMTDLVSPLRAFYQTKEWQVGIKEQPALDTIRTIAELPGTYPYRRSADLSREVSPLLRDAFLGSAEIKTALQQAQTIADRVLAQ